MVGKSQNKLIPHFLLQIFLGRETHSRHSVLLLIFKTANQCQQHKGFCKIAQKLGRHLSRQTVSGYLEKEKVVCILLPESTGWGKEMA